MSKIIFSIQKRPWWGFCSVMSSPPDKGTAPAPYMLISLAAESLPVKHLSAFATTGCWLLEKHWDQYQLSNFNAKLHNCTAKFRRGVFKSFPISHQTTPRIDFGSVCWLNFGFKPLDFGLGKLHSTKRSFWPQVLLELAIVKQTWMLHQKQSHQAFSLQRRPWMCYSPA